MKNLTLRRLAIMVLALFILALNCPDLLAQASGGHGRAENPNAVTNYDKKTITLTNAGNVFAGTFYTVTTNIVVTGTAYPLATNGVWSLSYTITTNLNDNGTLWYYTNTNDPGKYIVYDPTQQNGWNPNGYFYTTHSNLSNGNDLAYSSYAGINSTWRSNPSTTVIDFHTEFSLSLSDTLVKVSDDRALRFSNTNNVFSGTLSGSATTATKSPAGYPLLDTNSTLNSAKLSGVLPMGTLTADPVQTNGVYIVKADGTRGTTNAPTLSLINCTNLPKILYPPVYIPLGSQNAGTALTIAQGANFYSIAGNLGNNPLKVKTANYGLEGVIITNITLCGAPSTTATTNELQFYISQNGANTPMICSLTNLTANTWQSTNVVGTTFAPGGGTNQLYFTVTNTGAAISVYSLTLSFQYLK